MTATLPCLDCGAAIQPKRRGRKPKRCHTCAQRRHDLQKADHRREIDAERELLREVAGNLREYVTPDMWATIEDYISALGVHPGTAAPIVPDRMPEGSSSDAGPDEGVTTSCVDLQDTLEQRRMRAILHEWFIDNPRWADGVNG